MSGPSDHAPSETALAYPDPPFRLPYRFMAIDMGSNATRYRIWRIAEDGEARIMESNRFPLRLGRGVFAEGRLDDEIMDRAIETVSAILKRADTLGVNGITGVTTSAMREAANREELIERVRASAGLTLAVLTEGEEARLGARGIIGGRDRVEGEHLLIDIGGGSTEVTLTEGLKIIHDKSMRLGTVRLTGLFFREIPPAPEQIRQAESHITATLGRHLELPPPAGPRDCLGCAGTVTALQVIGRHFKGRAGADNAMTLGQVDAMVERMKGMTPAELVEEYEIKPDRAEVLLAGGLILQQLMRHLGQNELECAEGGVGDGLLHEFLERIREG